MSGVSNHSVWWLHVPLNQEFGQVASTYDCVLIFAASKSKLSPSASLTKPWPRSSHGSRMGPTSSGAWAAEFSGGVELRPWGAAAAESRGPLAGICVEGQPLRGWQRGCGRGRRVGGAARRPLGRGGHWGEDIADQDHREPHPEAAVFRVEVCRSRCCRCQGLAVLCLRK